MKEVSSKGGRTVLFVSHNLNAVQNLCEKALYLEQGRKKSFSNCFEVLKTYQNSAGSSSGGRVPKPNLDHLEAANVTEFFLEDEKGREKEVFWLGEPWIFRVRFKIHKPQKDFVIALGVTTLSGVAVQTCWLKPGQFQPGNYEAKFTQNQVALAAGSYELIIGLSSKDKSIQQFSATQIDILSKTIPSMYVALASGAGHVVNSIKTNLQKLGS